MLEIETSDKLSTLADTKSSEILGEAADVVFEFDENMDSYQVEFENGLLLGLTLANKLTPGSKLYQIPDRSGMETFYFFGTEESVAKRLEALPDDENDED